MTHEKTGAPVRVRAAPIPLDHPAPFTRRAMIAGAAAAVVIAATPVAIGQATAAMPDGDAPLFDLLSEWRTLLPAVRQAGAALQQARQSIEHLAPTVAERKAAERAHIADRFEALLERRLAAAIGEEPAPARPLASEIIAAREALAAKDAEYQRVRAAAGIDAMVSVTTGMVVRLGVVFEAIESHEPTTAAGLRAKMDFLHEVSPDGAAPTPMGASETMPSSSTTIA